MVIALVGRCRSLRRPVFGVMSKIGMSSQDDLGQGPACSALGMEVDSRFGGIPVRRTPGSADSRLAGLPVRRTPGSHELWSALPIMADRRNQESAEPGVRGTGTPRNQESVEPGPRNRDHGTGIPWNRVCTAYLRQVGSGQIWSKVG